MKKILACFLLFFVADASAAINASWRFHFLTSATSVLWNDVTLYPPSFPAVFTVPVVFNVVDSSHNSWSFGYPQGTSGGIFRYNYTMSSAGDALRMYSSGVGYLGDFGFHYFNNYEYSRQTSYSFAGSQNVTLCYASVSNHRNGFGLDWYSMTASSNTNTNMVLKVPFVSDVPPTDMDFYYNSSTKGLYTLQSLTLNTDGNGQVSWDGESYSDNLTSASVHSDTSTTIYAQPVANYSFNYWELVSGTGVFANSSSASTTISGVTATTVVKAHFKGGEYILTVVSNSGSLGTISIDGAAYSASQTLVCPVLNLPTSVLLGRDYLYGSKFSYWSFSSSFEGVLPLGAFMDDNNRVVDSLGNYWNGTFTLNLSNMTGDLTVTAIFDSDDEALYKISMPISATDTRSFDLGLPTYWGVIRDDMITFNSTDFIWQGNTNYGLLSVSNTVVPYPFVLNAGESGNIFVYVKKKDITGHIFYCVNYSVPQVVFPNFTFDKKYEALWYVNLDSRNYIVPIPDSYIVLAGGAADSSVGTSLADMESICVNAVGTTLNQKLGQLVFTLSPSSSGLWDLKGLEVSVPSSPDYLLPSDDAVSVGSVDDISLTSVAGATTNVLNAPSVVSAASLVSAPEVDDVLQLATTLTSAGVATNEQLQTSFDSLNAQIKVATDALKTQSVSNTDTLSSNIRSDFTALKSQLKSSVSSLLSASDSSNSLIIKGNTLLSSIKTNGDDTNNLLGLINSNILSLGQTQNGVLAARQLGIASTQPSLGSMTVAGTSSGNIVASAIRDYSGVDSAVVPPELVSAQPDMVVQVGMATVDMNFLNNETALRIASLIRGFSFWCLIYFFMVWVQEKTQILVMGLNQAEQAKGNPVIAGTGAQATALSAAIVITSIILAAFVAIFSLITSSFLSLSSMWSFLGLNPLADIGSGPAWFIDQLFPVSTLWAILIGRLVFSWSALAVYQFSVTLIRHVVP